MDGTLGGVMGDLQADIILGYWGGEWMAASRSAEGEWRGPRAQESIRAGRGYWVHALADDAIETALSPDTAQPSPEGCGRQLPGEV